MHTYKHTNNKKQASKLANSYTSKEANTPTSNQARKPARTQAHTQVEKQPHYLRQTNSHVTEQKKGPWGRQLPPTLDVETSLAASQLLNLFSFGLPRGARPWDHTRFCAVSNFRRGERQNTKLNALRVGGCTVRPALPLDISLLRCLLCLLGFRSSDLRTLSQFCVFAYRSSENGDSSWFCSSDLRTWWEF